jgi:tetratricopeptide (TPR) repeat protein/tRNA A-37 threonylcarbamoyl transferase component Bud32
MTESAKTLLLRLDQRQRWQRGDRVRVETYLEEQPGLAADREAVLDLIYNEIVLREEFGEEPRLEEYLQRFPDLETELRVQFEVHRLIEVGSAASNPDGSQRSWSGPPRVVDPLFVSKRDVTGYEVLGELGRGGMGVVYRARHLALNRHVALKMILTGVRAGARERARFRREAEAAARLQHPNIVQIYEVGEQDGCLFLALELVEGVDLCTRFGEALPTPQQAALLVATLAQAMHYAHQRGIVHRDLKPSNVLLTADGVPKISDFGLAKLLDAAPGQTFSDAFVGTPGYMAPEQAAGNIKVVGPAADIHALGAILYELLTGQRPFDGTTLLEVLERLRSQEPVRPGVLNPKVPRELETICLKCLAREPERRYGTAAELAEDLQRFLEGVPIQARPAGWGERIYKWSKRRPATALLVIASVLAMASVPALLVWHQRDAQAQALRQADKFAKFIRYRDDAFFHGLYGAGSVDKDVAANMAATRDAALRALALVGMKGDSGDPVPEPLWSEAQKTEVSASCGQLLVMLSEASIFSLSPRSAANQRADVLRALQVLDHVIAKAPAAPAYHLRRARYLTLIGARDGARRELTLAHQLKPASAYDYFLLGEETYRNGDVDGARRHFRNALALQPADFWSRYFLAICDLGRNPQQASDELSDCIKLKPEFVYGHLLAGSALERLQRFEEADACYRRAEQLHPNEDALYSLFVIRGRMRLNRRRLSDAESDLRRAVALRPDKPEPYIDLADACRQQRKLAEALSLLDRAISLQPMGLLLANCHVERGYVFYLEQRSPEALDECRQALAVEPDLAVAHGVRARALLQLGRYEDAIRAFDEYAAKRGSPDADVYRGRGGAHMKLRNYLAAVDDYSRVLEMQADPQMYADRGWAYFFADALKPALRDFQEAVRINPADGEAYVGRGLAQVMLGDYRAAVGDAEEALRRKLASAEMMHNVACVFAQAAAKAEADPNQRDRRDLSRHYRLCAIDAIRRSLALVPAAQQQSFWRTKVLTDKWLDSIRDRPEFKQIAVAFR